MKPISLKSKIERFDSNLWHYHVVVPEKIASQLVMGKDRRICCTLNGKKQFQAALMHKGDGNYFININKQLRDSLRLNEGDTVNLILEKDTSEYGLPVPNELAAVFEQDPDGFQIFQSLTPGKQRTLLHIAGTVKHTDLRIKRALAIVAHLHATQGKIDYKKLNVLLKA